MGSWRRKALWPATGSRGCWKGHTKDVLAMFKPSKNITAGELLQRLEADPEFVRKRAEQERDLAERAARSRAQQAPLLADLAASGVKVETVWDLVNRAGSYDQALPVLLDHLQRPYSDSIREGIARALAVPATRPIGWSTLVEEFRRTDATNKQVKDGLAVALAGASDDTVLADLVDLAKEKSHGSSRILLLLGIKRSKHPEAKQAVAELIRDRQLAKEINSWRKGRD